MNRYDAPKTQVAGLEETGEQEIRYAGFWIRVVAALIDSFWVTLAIVPLLYWLYGSGYFTQISDNLQGMMNLDLQEPGPAFAGPGDFVVQYVVPAVAIVLFWIARQATPGKMLLSLKIVDAQTLGPISKGQAIGRYLGYYVSILGLCLGLLWVAFDPRKQGWHDKLARTVVIRERR